jgi:hypothetical protein
MCFVVMKLVERLTARTEEDELNPIDEEDEDDWWLSWRVHLLANTTL